MESMDTIHHLALLSCNSEHVLGNLSGFELFDNIYIVLESLFHLFDGVVLFHGRISGTQK